MRFGKIDRFRELGYGDICWASDNRQTEDSAEQHLLPFLILAEQEVERYVIDYYS